MAFTKAYIPYGGYWSSPYVKWQGALADLHSIDLASKTAKKFFEMRGISAEQFDNLYLGLTIPQTQCFYGGPWMAGLMGNGNITGPWVNQACITGAVCIKMASQDVVGVYDQAPGFVAQLLGQTHHISSAGSRQGNHPVDSAHIFHQG